MCDGLDDGSRIGLRVGRVEDARSDENAIASEHHAESRICRCRNTASGEVDDGQTAKLGDLLDELDGRPDLLCVRVELGLGKNGQETALLRHLLCVLGRCDDVAGAGFSLRPDHSCTLCNPSQGLAEILASAHEWHVVLVLVDVLTRVRRREDLGLVDVVDAKCLDDLGPADEDSRTVNTKLLKFGHA